MSLELILQAGEPAKQELTRPISPTLVIGLGGTGKECLLRLRRLLVERFGSLSEMPFIRFLHLDTDRTAMSREQYDLRKDDDPLYERIAFGTPERIDLTIDSGTGAYVEHIDSYPNIKRWFQVNGKIAGLGNLGDGAGQIRMASRLGLYHEPNFMNVSTTLGHLRARLEDASNPQAANRLGFQLGSSINVFVVASLAGGTGSGIFLDIGFLLRKHFRNSERVGILLLPGFFQEYTGGERAKANGFAALMELNHYSFGHSFEANWERNDREMLLPPPFSHTYLIDSRNEARRTIGSSGQEYDAYSMVAEFLYQDFSASSFAGLKRATRVNLVNFNLNVYSHNFLNTQLASRRDGEREVLGDTYPTRFGSFGLASISFPTDRVQTACAARLARRILHFWQQALTEDGLERLFVTVLNHNDVKFVQGRYERRNNGGLIEGAQVEDALRLCDLGSHKSFQNLIWEKSQELRVKLQGAAMGTKAALLRGAREQLEIQLMREDVESSEEWGHWVRILETNYKVYSENLRSALRKRVQAIADNLELGVVYSLAVLTELKKLLQHEGYKYVKHFSDAVARSNSAIEYYGGQLDQLAFDLEQYEGRLMFRQANVDRCVELLAPEDNSGDLGVFYNYFNSRVMKQVYKRGSRVCRDVDEFLGKDDPTGKGEIANYYRLLGGFQKLEERLERKARYFAKEVVSQRNLSLYRPEDVDRWYQTWIGSGEVEKTKLKVIGNQLLTKVFKVDSVSAALGSIQSTSQAEIEERLIIECKNFIQGQEEQPEALRMLLEEGRFDRGQLVEKIRLMYDLSKVWAAPPEGGLEHARLPAVSAGQRPCLIGVDQQDRVLFQQFRDLIEGIRAGSDSPPAYQSIGDKNKGAIIFYNELAGVPAFYPSSVLAQQGLRHAYDRHLEKEDLHFDKNRLQFGDLIPKKKDESIRFTDALKAFVLGRLLGLLRVREIRQAGNSEVPAITYIFRRTSRVAVEDIDLGDEDNAIDTLYRDLKGDLSDRSYLILAIEDVLRRLKEGRKLYFYFLLIEFYMQHVYRPQRETLEEREVTLIQYSPKFAVLRAAREAVEYRQATEAELKEIGDEIERLTGARLGEPIEHGRFLEILSPFTKLAGKVVSEAESEIGVRRKILLDTPALDLDTILPVRSPANAPKAVGVRPPEPPAPPASFPKRPCPSCGHPIDLRAIYCINCSKLVAEHVECTSCGEPRVPSDLAECWKCRQPMPVVQAIECPRCFSYSGPVESFPCPVCAFDFAEEDVDPNEPRFGGGEPGREGVGGERKDEVAMVICATCLSEVESGATCSRCGALLS